MAADRQRRQRDRALGDGASVRQSSRWRASAASIDHSATAPSSRSIRASVLRGVSRNGRDERLVGAQHKRKGQAATLCLIDEPRQALARLGFARDLEPKPGQKRDLGFRRDDRALAADVCPFRGDPGRRGKLADRLDAGRSGIKAAARVFASVRMSDERARSRTRSASGKPALRRRGIVRVDDRAPRHASARRGQMNLRRLRSSGSSPRPLDRRRRPAAWRRPQRKRRPWRSFHALWVIGPLASRHSTSGSWLASNGDPVRKASRDSAALARRTAMSLVVKAIREASAARQSIALVALSWA